MRSNVVVALVGLSLVAAASGCAEKESVKKVSTALTREASIAADLKAFRTDTKTFMNRHVPKRDSAGQIVENSEFSQELQDNRDYVTRRDAIRKRFCTTRDGVEVCLSQVEPGKAPFGGDDRAQDLVDSPDTMLTRLEDMESLRRASLKESPWSDTYWPIYQGQLGNRYADGGFPGSDDWQDNATYTKENNANLIFQTGNASSVDSLSPSEKYDLLVGDRRLTFTGANWRVGEQYYKTHGSVETWMGLCHGWAPAAYMLERPTNAVTVTAADGVTKLRLYPSDIKALATSLWANVRTPSRFIGGRCNTKEPQTDANGRIIGDECWDNNPGTWHQVIVNQIGRSKRSFVMDATFDYEVWNQPVFAYQYSYFNPKTDKPTNSLQAAAVARENLPNDPFREYRSADARYIVGVSMDVTYVVETNPSHRLTDKAANDGLNTVTYLYDLELDAKGKIVGGEWYGNEHPDFLWTPPADHKARAYGDQFAQGGWAGNQGMNQTWQQAAAASSAKGQPLGKVVETLIGLSRAGVQ